MPSSLTSGINGRPFPRLTHNVMLRRVWGFDWTSTPIGGIETWPDDLRCLCRTVLLSSTPMSVLIGQEGLVIYNDAVRLMFGAVADGFLGRSIADALPDVAGFYRQMLGRTFEGRSSSFRDLPLTLVRNGVQERAWFDLDFAPIIGARGQIHGALVVSIETTERVRALTDLQVSHERLDAALTASGIVGTWEVDFATETVRSDERYARLHGVDPELAKSGASKDLFIAGIHPDDRDRVMMAFDRAKIDGVYRCLHRVVGLDGIRWIVNSGRVMRLSSGPPSSFAGVVVDITEQVEAAEDILRQSEQRFTKAFRLTPVPTVVSTRKGLHLLDVNDAFVSVLGFSEEEVVGKPGPAHSIWISAASRLQLEQEIEKNGSFRNIEVQLRTKHEEILDCLVSAETVTIRGEKCVLTTIQDITERKRTEVELIAAIEAVMKDTSWFSRTVIEKLANLRRPGGASKPAAELSDLTGREQEILALMCQGLSDAEITKALKLTRNTVRNHIARIYNKTDVHSRAAAIIWARERGFTSPTNKLALGTRGQPP